MKNNNLLAVESFFHAWRRIRKEGARDGVRDRLIGLRYGQRGLTAGKSDPPC